MPVINRFPSSLREIDNIIWFNDFFDDQSDLNFIDTLSDAGTVSIGDAKGGILALVPSDGTVTDNDEVYASTPNALFQFANNKPAYCQFYLQFTEGNVNHVNVFAGFMDAIGANSIVDNGAGLKTSFDGACIYKVDGETVWRCVTSRGTTQTISVSTTTAGGAGYQKLEIIVSDDQSTRCKVNFKVNGEYLRDANGFPINHYILYASNAKMMLGCGIKGGEITTVEQLNVDYALGEQVR